MQETTWSTPSSTLGRLLPRDGLFLAHGRHDRDQHVLSFIKCSINVPSKVTVRDFDIVFGITVVVQEVQKTIINVSQAVFLPLNVRDVHVVCRWADIFQFFTRENVDGDEMDLGMSVLSSLGSRHIDDFAGAAFYDDMAVFAESRTLHGVGERGACAGPLEGLVVSLIVRHRCGSGLSESTWGKNRGDERRWNVGNGAGNGWS